jgi:hypothetical protein
MFQVSRLGHRRRHVNHRRQRVNPRGGANPLHIVHAVLQAHHNRTRREMRRNRARCFFVVLPLHAKKHHVCVTHRGWICRNIYRDSLLKRDSIQEKFVPAYRFHVRAPRNHRHGHARACQHPAKIRSDGARAHHHYALRRGIHFRI